jgi:hypothetical protein
MSNNTKLGSDALKNNTGNDNTGIGAYSAYNNQEGFNNTAIGSNSAFFNITGDNNTSVGAGSLCNNTTGSLNTAIGSSALEGQNNQSVGNENVAVGAQALFLNTTTQNTAIGTYCLKNNTTGGGHSAVGYNSLVSNTIGDKNSALGWESLASNISGSENTSVGFGSLNSCTSGNKNTGIGYNSGYTNNTGQYNTYIGSNADATGNNYNYSTALGYNSKITDSNQIMLGGNNGSEYPNVIIPGQAFLPNFVATANENQIVPKSYVDTVAIGLKIGQTCVCATTAIINLSLTTAPAAGDTDNFDLSTLANGSYYVLVANQGSATTEFTSNSQNGVYKLTVSLPTFTFSRPPAGESGSIGDDAAGEYSFILNGTLYGNTALVQINDPAIVGTPPNNLLKYQIMYQFKFDIGQGLYTLPITPGPEVSLNVDSSLNFINYLDSTSGVPNASGTLSIGTNTTNIIIGPTGGNPVLFQGGLTVTDNTILGIPSGSSDPLTETWAQIYSINPTPLTIISASSNGTYIATNSSSNLYVSNNSGQNFTVTTNNNIVGKATVSSSGQYMGFISVQSGEVILVSNDYGQSFRIGVNYTNGFFNIAISSNGILYASGYSGGSIFVVNCNSASFIRNITPATISNGYPGLIAGNSDLTGNTLLVYANRVIQITTNGTSAGATWTTISTTAPAINTNYGVAADDTLTYISVIGGSPIGIYYSSNGGSSFAIGTGTSGLQFSAIAVSSSGQYQTACINGGGIYYSGNYGANWNLTLAPSLNWNSITINSAGSVISAVTNTGYVYQSLANEILPKTTINGILEGRNGTLDISGNLTITEELIVNGPLVGTSGILNSMQLGIGVPSLGNNTLDVSGNILFVSDITNTSNTEIGYDLGIISSTANADPGVLNTSIGVLSNGYQTGFIASRGTGLNSGVKNFFAIFQDALNNGNYNPIVRQNDHVLLSGEYGSGSGLADASGGIVICPWSSTTSGARMDVLGNFTFYNPITCTSSITATSFIQPSDYRIKDNITQLDNTFTVDKLNPVKYKNLKTDKQDIGLIAHELQEQYPYLVNGEKDGEEMQSVNYLGLIGILIKEIKELKERVNILEENKIKIV